MKIKKFNETEKLNEELTDINEITAKLNSIRQHYSNIGLKTEDGLFKVYGRNDFLYLETNANQLGLDIVNSFLAGVLNGLSMAGKNITDYKPVKRKINKLDPYGEEDWDN